MLSECSFQTKESENQEQVKKKSIGNKYVEQINKSRGERQKNNKFKSQTLKKISTANFYPDRGGGESRCPQWTEGYDVTAHSTDVERAVCGTCLCQ